MMKPEEYMQQAYRCILQNDFEQAIRWFESAIHAHPKHAELYYRCSITHARSKHLVPALEYARAKRLNCPQEQKSIFCICRRWKQKN